MLEVPVKQSELIRQGDKCRIIFIASEMQILNPDETYSICITPPPIYQDMVELTSRENEIAELISKRFSNKEIAVQLGISRRTVEIHRSNIVRKLRLKSKRDQIGEYYQHH